MNVPAHIFLVNLVSTLFMVGVIWFVQVAHYPLLTSVGEEAFVSYQHTNMRLTTWVVMPAMLVEVATALALLKWRPDFLAVPVVWCGIALLAVIWISTMILQVPEHNILAKGYEAGAANRLVQTNWIRTVAWSLRGGLLFVPLLRFLRSA